jgi:hypothetical protein
MVTTKVLQTQDVIVTSVMVMDMIPHVLEDIQLYTAMVMRQGIETDGIQGKVE